MNVPPVSSRRQSNPRVIVVTLAVVALIVILSSVVLVLMLGGSAGPAQFASGEPRVEWVIGVETDAAKPGPHAGAPPAVVGVQQTIVKRLRGMPVTKWNVTRRSTGELLVQVAAAPDPAIARVRTVISTPGVFELRLVDRTSAVVTDADIATARATRDELGKPAVTFGLTKEGAERMRTATAQHVGAQLAIVIDGHVQSAPIIEGPISEAGRITGNFTDAEANDLAVVLRSGHLPAPVRILSEQWVDPKPRR